LGGQAGGDNGGDQSHDRVFKRTIFAIHDEKMKLFVDSCKGIK